MSDEKHGWSRKRFGELDDVLRLLMICTVMLLLGSVSSALPATEGESGSVTGPAPSLAALALAEAEPALGAAPPTPECDDPDLPNYCPPSGDCVQFHCMDTCGSLAGRTTSDPAECKTKAGPCPSDQTKKLGVLSITKKALGGAKGCCKYCYQGYKCPPCWKEELGTSPQVLAFCTQKQTAPPIYGCCCRSSSTPDGKAELLLRDHCTAQGGNLVGATVAACAAQKAVKTGENLCKERVCGSTITWQPAQETGEMPWVFVPTIWEVVPPDQWSWLVGTMQLCTYYQCRNAIGQLEDADLVLHLPTPEQCRGHGGWDVTVTIAMPECQRAMVARREPAEPEER